MTYEAYEEPARRVMEEIVAEARRRWPGTRAGRVVASSRRVDALRAVGGRRRVFAASRRRVRGCPVLHRHVEGDRADLEAGALGGGLRLGARRAPDPVSEWSHGRVVGYGTGRGLERGWPSCCLRSLPAVSASRPSWCVIGGRARWSTASRSSSAACARLHPSRRHVVADPPSKAASCPAISRSTLVRQTHWCTRGRGGSSSTNRR